MDTYHHLSPQSMQFISIVYEFAEKELKNKGYSIHNFKIFLLNDQIGEAFIPNRWSRAIYGNVAGGADL